MLNKAVGNKLSHSACTSQLYENASMNQQPSHECGTASRVWFDAVVHAFLVSFRIVSCWPVVSCAHFFPW